MKANNPLKKLTLIKTTIAHLGNEQMTAARGGSCGDTRTIVETENCVKDNTDDCPVACGFTINTCW